MILPDTRLHRLCEEQGLVTPYDPLLVNPHSIDLRLGKWVRRPMQVGHSKGPRWKDAYEHSGFWLHQGQFALLSTLERIRMPRNCRGTLFCKSTAGRDGINHVMAAYVDAGFEGHLTLEVFNVHPDPAWIEPGMRIVQLELAQLLSEPLFDYRQTGRYCDQGERPEPAREERETLDYI